MKSPAKPLAARKAAHPAPSKAAPAKPTSPMKTPTAKATPPAKASAKPASKVTAAPVKKPAAVPAKKAAAPSKAVPAPVPKPVAKAAPKTSAKTAPVALAKAPAAKAAPKAPLSPTKSAAPAAKPAQPKAAPLPPAAPIVHATGIVKAVRPSSRLVQITVPSMAQSVASTAAKSSFLPTDSRDELHPLVPHAIKKDPKLAGNWKKKAPGELSDAELIAMPDNEYMNEVQLSAFRLKLVALKNGILSNAGETTEHLREDTSVMPDPADRATIEEEHALELRTRDRERKLLKKIEQAISRIDTNEYGYCDETGEPIGVGRLLARPTATLSLEAQQRRELKQKMFGD